jgi:hypothetical protein
MKHLFGFLLMLLCLTVHSQDVDAAGTAGLNYQNYAAGGAMPGYTQDANGNITNRTLLTTGTVNTVGLTTSSGAGLPTRSDGFIVRFYGFINIPTAGTYYFGGQADDGIRIKVNNVSLVNSWIESGGDFRQSGPITLSAGAVPVEIMYYENGGGQMVNFWWFINGSWQIVPSTVLATDSTYFTPVAPALCCGGSSAAFSANSTNVANVQGFTNRVIKDSQVYIDQIGDDNTITITQQGTKENKVSYQGNGSNNIVTINQTGNNSTTTNYIDLKITGDSNTANLTQTSTGGGKGIFATINNNNNSLIVQQKDSGSHYADIIVSGGNKNVDVLQQGSGNHMTKIDLSGNPVNLNLTQSGSTQQFYSIQHTCATAGGCAAITVTQGQ